MYHVEYYYIKAYTFWCMDPWISIINVLWKEFHFIFKKIVKSFFFLFILSFLNCYKNKENCSFSRFHHENHMNEIENHSSSSHEFHLVSIKIRSKAWKAKEFVSMKLEKTRFSFISFIFHNILRKTFFFFVNLLPNCQTWHKHGFQQQNHFFLLI